MFQRRALVKTVMNIRRPLEIKVNYSTWPAERPSSAYRGSRRKSRRNRMQPPRRGGRGEVDGATPRVETVGAAGATADATAGEPGCCRSWRGKSRTQGWTTSTTPTSWKRTTLRAVGGDASLRQAGAPCAPGCSRRLEAFCPSAAETRYHGARFRTGSAWNLLVIRAGVTRFC